MDEVTKTIIETSVTILGMIAAFITAFLAEPVKNYFTNRAKSHHLRVALYKELINNYYALTHFTTDGTDADSYLLYQVAKYELRAECYKNTLQNELPLFYQLTEANVLNVIYGRINQLMNLSSDLSAIYGKRGLKSTSSIFTQHGNTFKYMFTTSFYYKTFDAKILRKLVTLEQYKAIMEKGKEADTNHVEQ